MSTLKKHRWLVVTFYLFIAPASLAADSSSASTILLKEAKEFFVNKEIEQAAALIERALRISPKNPVLWHNLAGVRLEQEQWSRAASLAAKSNSLAVKKTMLRVRNWVVIALACEGLGDAKCANESRKRARTLAAQ